MYVVTVGAMSDLAPIQLRTSQSAINQGGVMNYTDMQGLHPKTGTNECLYQFHLSNTLSTPVKWNTVIN